MIQDALDEDMPGTRVSVGAPRAGTDGEASVHLLLYQATRNAAFRNIDFPPRRPERPARAAVALDLHYLVCLGGTPAGFMPEQLLAVVARAIERHPVITPATIERTLSQNENLQGGPELRAAMDAARVQPANLTLEDLAKIWTMLSPAPFALTLGYSCGPVMIDVSAPPPSPLPVQ
jgi:hypothetical protein